MKFHKLGELTAMLTTLLQYQHKLLVVTVLCEGLKNFLLNNLVFYKGLPFVKELLEHQKGSTGKVVRLWV